VAAFDIDPQRVGATIEGVRVFHWTWSKSPRKQIKLGMIAVPHRAQPSRIV